MRSTQKELRQFIASELGRDVSGVADAESLLEAGVIDSMGVLELVSFIEKQYRIAVAEDEMMPENFDSVDAIAAFIDRRRSDGAV
ncbi:MAG TPA: acyl carrier protein [Vicinamibacterales bacterium]|nr:acyl carrier protein [Vicinamibacterales bacterium]